MGEHTRLKLKRMFECRNQWTKTNIIFNFMCVAHWSYAAKNATHIYVGGFLMKYLFDINTKL